MIHDCGIAAGNTLQEEGKPDGIPVGEIVSALNVWLSHRDAEKIQRVGATRKPDGTAHRPGKLLNELNNKNIKMA